jgi:hypothetical protein
VADAHGGQPNSGSEQMLNAEQVEAVDQVMQDQLAQRTHLESVTDCNKAVAELSRAKAAFWRGLGFAVALFGIGGFAVLIALTVHI